MKRVGEIVGWSVAIMFGISVIAGMVKFIKFCLE
jgi:hypothetical protein